jgi:hypothetical protein
VQLLFKLSFLNKFLLWLNDFQINLSLSKASQLWPAINTGFAASVAGRKYNRRFYKAQLQSGQDKQL